MNGQSLMVRRMNLERLSFIVQENQQDKLPDN